MVKIRLPQVPDAGTRSFALTRYHLGQPVQGTWTFAKPRTRRQPSVPADCTHRKEYCRHTSLYIVTNFLHLRDGTSRTSSDRDFGGFARFPDALPRPKDNMR